MYYFQHVFEHIDIKRKISGETNIIFKGTALASSFAIRQSSLTKYYSYE
ncbi:MAG: hypothetical protein IJP19_02715 [Clostridia bacterium]|nr:hypothetical protein [Clostridia bacterium]